jgi:hypothetical protein
VVGSFDRDRGQRGWSRTGQLAIVRSHGFKALRCSVITTVGLIPHTVRPYAAAYTAGTLNM